MVYLGTQGHKVIHEIQNSNTPLVYELELSIDFKLVDLARGGRVSAEIS
jgi:hypothetical protein